MGLRMLHLLLITNAFNMTKEKLTYSYRFDVYPVDQCPMNANQFEAAAKKRNCTEDSRYLCAPDKNLTHLIEFCTDTKKSLYEKGNCVRLEGTGDLNHYSCKDKFISGCPTSPFTDDEIYRYPKCLDINRDFKCFVFDKDCPGRFSYTTGSYSGDSGGQTKESKNKETPEDGVNTNFAAVIGVFVTLSAVEGIMILICYIKKKKGKGNPNNKERDTLLDVEKGEKNRRMNDICNGNGKDESTTKGLVLGQFLSYEKLTLSNIRCTVVGCKGAGMKTFLQSLEKEIYKEQKTTNSKDTVDISINNSEVCEDKTQKLPIFKNKKNHKSNNDWNEEHELSTEKTEFLPKEDNKEKGKCKQLPQGHGKTAPKMGIKGYIDNITEEQDEEVITCLMTSFGYYFDEKSANSKLMDVVEQSSIEKHIHSRFAFFECAEQTLFNAFHNIYFLQKTCFILVVDMRKSLDEQLCDENCDSRYKTWTYKDYYKFWLKTIQRFRGTKTPLIVVGTHADILSQKKSSSFFEDFSKTVELRCCTDDIRWFVLGCPDTDSHLKGMKNIKQCITSYMEDPEIISPMWALFAYIFGREKPRKIISKGFFSNVNEQLTKNDSLIREMLLFLHRIGTLLYFNESSLNETIILDIPWFFEAFKLIIAHFMNKSDTERLQNTGNLDDKDLKLIWENSENKEYILHMPEILQCMEHLGLLAICNTESSNEGQGQWYYIPSMNKRKYENNDGTVTKSSILCFEFDEKGQTPSFLFNRLVIKCMKIPEWSIFEHRLYEHAACFSFRNHIVAMCLCKFQIQVQVRRMEKGPIDPYLLYQVQNLVEEKLKMNEEHSFKTGYKCEHSKFNVEENDSFISVEDISNSKQTCRKWTESDAHVDNTILSEQRENNQPQSYESPTYFNEPTGVWISPHILQNKILFVAALDFGTTYSGIAWSFPWESENKITCFMWSPSEQGCQATIKTPTVLLLNPNKELLAFGYEAEEEYNKLVAKNSHREYYHFKNFKMFLYENENPSNYPFIKDAEGHTMHAKDVFGHCIKYMKNKLLEELKKTDNLIREENIMWVVTVPAIWNESAYQFMTEAAMLAGIPQHQICLALEPEAASIHTKLLIDRKNDHRQQNPVFKEKTKFILLDLGGGTVEMSLKEISEGNNMKMIHHASGGPWGSLRVNKELMNFFENLVGKQVLQELEQNHKAAWLDLEREIEDKKKIIGSDNDGPIRIQIPAELLELYVKMNNQTLREAIESNIDYQKKIFIERNFLCVEKSKSETFFKESLSQITEHVKRILAKPEAAGLDYIVLVGGFAESKYIKDKLPKSLGFAQKHVFIPAEPWPAVLKGAVLFGLKLYKDGNMNLPRDSN